MSDAAQTNPASIPAPQAGAEAVAQVAVPVERMKLLPIIHRAIRGDRNALRALLELYKGLTYALAFAQTKSFPHAQRVAKASWPIAAQRLPFLQEPERFPQLLAGAVNEAGRLNPPEARSGEDADSASTGHSIMRTEKVQARRALRLALSECEMPESAVFFLRFVEGLSLEQIGDLYGADSPSALKALKLVVIDLAFRAGLAGPNKTAPDLATLTPERRDALGFAVEHTESGVDEDRVERIAQFVQRDADAKREDDAVRTLLALAPTTFAGHRLAQDFGTEVLMQIPYIDLPRTVLPDPPTQMEPMRFGVPSRPAVDQSETARNVTFGVLCGIGVGFVTNWIISGTAQFRGGVGYSFSSPEPATLILIFGLGLIALLFIAPPFRAEARRPGAPLGFYLCYFGAVGMAACLLLMLGQMRKNSAAAEDLIHEIYGPAWAVIVFGLLCYRVRALYLDVNRRVEARFRKLEEQAPVNLTEPVVPPSKPPTNV